jgi:RNA polymerase sigma-70 factor (ECF subfamily)
MRAKITNQYSASTVFQNDLIEACKRGDHRAQLQVYKLYYKPVYNICLRLVNDPVTAEDIMHESFLSAFENISSYCGDISFSSWINSFIKYTANHE